MAEHPKAEVQAGAVAEPTRRLLLPLRNRHQGFFEVSPWFLGDNIHVDQISGEDYATLHREAEEIFVPIVKPKSQCIVVALKKNDDAEQIATEVVSKVQFVFKTFSKAPPLLSHAAAVITQPGGKAKIEKTLLLAIHGDYSQFLADPFTFHAEVKAEQVIELYKVIDLAAQKQPSFAITLSRFNACWLRSSDHDKLIDIAISLESLLDSKVEIKFKFALFNSFITQIAPDKREETFELLCNLYDARSSIVHGDTKGTSAKKKIALALKSMGRILEIAHAAISYYALFLYSKSPEEWPPHIEKLVLGTTKRINE